MLTYRSRLIIIIIVFSLAAAGGLVMLWPRKSVNFEGAQPGDVSIPGEPTEGSLPFDVLMASTYRNTTTTAAPPPMAAPVIHTPSYTDVVKEFDTAGRRVQFSFDQQAACQARPTRFVARRDSVLMFDNRSDRAIAVILDGVTYHIPAYRYYLARASFSGGVGEYHLHCGKQFNVSTVLVRP